MNHRLRVAGGKIVFDPSIAFVYRPRESLGALSRQYREFGRWKAVMLSDSPESVRPRQFAPLMLVGTTLLALVPGRAGRVGRTGGVLYAAAMALEARRAGQWRVAPVLTTIHLSWAIGFLAGTAHVLRRRNF